MAASQGGGSDEEKSEEPSAQRLEDFREEGQVAQSKELTSMMVLAAALTAIYTMGPAAVSDFSEFFRAMILESAVRDLTTERAGKILMACIWEAGKLLLPATVAGLFAGVAGSILQFGFIITLEPLIPKFERLDPIQGFTRIFSMASVMEGVKSVFKLVAVASVTFLLVKSEILSSATSIEMEEGQFVSHLVATAFHLVGGVCIGLFVVAALDFVYQKIRYQKSLMMTKQEVKQEHKQREGDPLLKARVRSIQRERARKRMMAEVPKADVIVTNPTHYAVALRYDAEKMAAPKVIAKGTDLIAQRIKEVARQHGIPLVENVPLARALHKHVKVGGSVPRNLYQAVAEVLAYVYRLKGKFKLD